jgi:hypothetical protein
MGYDGKNQPFRHAREGASLSILIDFFKSLYMLLYWFVLQCVSVNRAEIFGIAGIDGPCDNQASQSHMWRFSFRGGLVR